MSDVSQFIQMQRLRASAARQPVRGDKTVTHLYQRQVSSSGISEFLPNPKTKNTDAATIQRYYYNRGIQFKEKIPGGYVWGNTPFKTTTTRQVSFTYDAGSPAPRANSDTLDGGSAVGAPSNTRDGGSV